MVFAICFVRAFIPAAPRGIGAAIGPEIEILGTDEGDAVVGLVAEEVSLFCAPLLSLSARLSLAAALDASLSASSIVDLDELTDA